MAEEIEIISKEKHGRTTKCLILVALILLVIIGVIVGVVLKFIA